MNESSPYLRQHAHNPVFWYPWGKEALDRARAENKPILVSIGYSTCYWCHVMEREVFENLSVASLMNKLFINIKIDREEHPELDEIYMVARQLMTHEGGWPNNVFLTPDLKPFYAGGTYGATDAYGKPGFPRLLEWLAHSWATQSAEVIETADKTLAMMRHFLTYAPEKKTAPPQSARAQADDLFAQLQKHYDGSSGGFFQAPKFPHEHYISFLLAYHELTGSEKALDMATFTLGKMAAGGIYDHVGCGFHRYAVDKEWHVPHFEKMLYTQAMMARLYAEAARITGNVYYADIAKGVLDFTRGPLTDGNGAFYAAIDAESDRIEGAYYAWTPEYLQAVLKPEEVNFFVHFYAPADIPQFPGHKHPEGQVIVARKPLDQAAREEGMPLMQLLAMSATVMNKLLINRNQRNSPGIDRKIIVGWNGLMIDAMAHAGRVLDTPRYVDAAKRAADYLLEHAIDNDGRLYRVVPEGRTRIMATLEDYAYLAKGVLSLWQANSDPAMLDAAMSLMQQADEIFADPAGGYFFSAPSELQPERVKTGDDGTLPNANAVMIGNFVELHRITGRQDYLGKAEALIAFFTHHNPRMIMEYATMTQLALRLSGGSEPVTPAVFVPGENLPVPAPDGAVQVTAALFPADARPGQSCEVIATIDIGEGWHINANPAGRPFLVPTQLDVQGEGMELIETLYPKPVQKTGAGQDGPLPVYEGLVNVTLRLKLSDKQPVRPKLTLRARFQPCMGTSCHKTHDIAIPL